MIFVDFQGRAVAAVSPIMVQLENYLLNERLEYWRYMNHEARVARVNTVINGWMRLRCQHSDQLNQFNGWH